MLETEASEAAAKRLQGEDSPNQLPPRGFRGKAAAIANKGVRDRGDERLILKLRGDATRPIGCGRGDLIRAVATAGEKIELQGGYQTSLLQRRVRRRHHDRLVSTSNPISCSSACKSSLTRSAKRPFSTKSGTLRVNWAAWLVSPPKLIVISPARRLIVTRSSGSASISAS